MPLRLLQLIDDEFIRKRIERNAPKWIGVTTRVTIEWNKKKMKIVFYSNEICNFSQFYVRHDENMR